MARFVKKLGTQQLRYQFDLELFDLKMEIPYSVTAQIILKKDQKRVESKSNPILGAGESTAKFGGEKLSLISTILRDKNSGGKFSEKTASIVIKI